MLQLLSVLKLITAIKKKNRNSIHIGDNHFNIFKIKFKITTYDRKYTRNNRT